MQRFTAKLATGIAASALVAQAFVPMAFAMGGTGISGNGAYSDNEVEIKNESSTSVVQANTAAVTNVISSSSSTGGNDANFNTGSDVVIMTGDAETIIDVENHLNRNYASVAPTMVGTDMDSLISGNGAYSDSEVEVKNENETAAFQTNAAFIVNDVDTHTSTGKNDADYNTGADVMVKTGKTQTGVGISNLANGNWAWVGSSMPMLSLLSGSGDAEISGNGAYSDNEIEYESETSTLVTQSNGAFITNEIDAWSKTGGNDAEFNTGGDVGIQTGTAAALVGVANKVNFNFAALGSDAVMPHFDSLISGNGAYSDSEVEVEGESEDALFQTNAFEVGNMIDAGAKTGHNDADFNTGDGMDDVVVMTGATATHMFASTEGNVNVSGPTWTVGDTSIDFDIDFGDLFGFFW